MTTNIEKKDTRLPRTSKKCPSLMIQVSSQKRKVEDIRSQSDTRTSDTKSRKEKEISLETAKLPKIWIIVSSYIHCGEEAVYEKFRENLRLQAKVELFGKGGMCWGGVLSRFYEDLSKQSPSDILVIYADGNDLGGVSAKNLHRK